MLKYKRDIIYKVSCWHYSAIWSFLPFKNSLLYSILYQTFFFFFLILTLIFETTRLSKPHKKPGQHRWSTFFFFFGHRTLEFPVNGVTLFSLDSDKLIIIIKKKSENTLQFQKVGTPKKKIRLLNCHFIFDFESTNGPKENIWNRNFKTFPKVNDVQNRC